MFVGRSSIIEGSLRFRARNAPPSGLEGRHGSLKVVTGLPTDAVDGVGESRELSVGVCFCSKRSVKSRSQSDGEKEELLFYQCLCARWGLSRLEPSC